MYLRAAFYGEIGRPGPAPDEGVASDEVFTEFRERLAPFIRMILDFLSRNVPTV